MSFKNFVDAVMIYLVSFAIVAASAVIASLVLDMVFPR